MKKTILLLCLSLTFQTLIANDNETKPAADDVKTNTWLPGYYQIQDGRASEGYLYMASLPLMLAGNALVFMYFNNEDFYKNLEFSKTVDDKYYLFYSEGFENMPNEWMWYAGNTFAIAGTLLYSYSQYDVYSNINPTAAPQISLLDAVTAPWQPENVFNLEVLPILTIEGGYDIYNTIDSGALNDYFSRDSVSFLGKEMSPGAALAAVCLSSMAFVSANATWEEIAYRGMKLQTDGIHQSSISFGLTHAPNAIMPNVAVQDTLYQTIFATAFGYYAGHITRNNNYDFSRAIAYHFWHNIIAFTTSYILEPDHHNMFCIQFNYSF